MPVVDTMIWFSCHARKLVLILTIAATVAAICGLAQLRLNDNLADLFKADNDEYRFLQQFLEEYGADDRDCVVLLQTEDFFTQKSISALRRTVQRLESMPEIESVHSILDAYRFISALGRKLPLSLIPHTNLNSEALEQARRYAHAHPTVAGHLLSADGRGMLIAIRLADESHSATDTRQATARIRNALDETLQQEEISFTLTGLAQLRSDIYLCIRREQIKFVLIGASVAALLATYLFRSFSAVVICCLPPSLGAVWTLGSMGLVGEPVNTLNSIVPALILVVGFTDAVHLLLEIRRERVRGLSPRGAAAASLRCLFLPCFLTSTTTAIGFASLAVAQLDVVQRFGLVCAAGALINFAAVVPLVPFLSTTWLGTGLGSSMPDQSGELRLESLLARLVHVVVTHAWLVSILGVTAALLLFYIASQLRPDNHLRAGIPNGTESYEALQYCDEAFGGVMYSYVVVEWPPEQELESLSVLRAIWDAQQVLSENEQLGPPISVLNLLQSLPHQSRRLQTAVRYLDSVPEKILDKMLRIDQRQAVVMAQTPDLGAKALKPGLARVEAQLQELAADHPGFQFQLTGSTVVAARNINLIIEDLVRSLGLAAIIILITLTIAFRSLRFGLLSLIPNVLPLLAAAAVLWLRGDGLEVQAVVTFSICLGVAVDDTIHVLNRYVLGITAGESTRSAVESATVRAGYALTITTLTMVGGFGAGLISELPALRVFSLLSCIALLTALLSSLVLLPALLICFRPKAP